MLILHKHSGPRSVSDLFPWDKTINLSSPKGICSAKYLGITIQQDMDWDNHINNVVNKANSMLGFLWCNLKISSSAIKDRAYKAFVRPILEYAADTPRKAFTSWRPSSDELPDSC